ncbi:unnamed protein product, partial [Nesidiocoris tenuis]
MSTLENHHRMSKAWRGCRNCLAIDHTTYFCMNRPQCTECPGKHNSLLHFSTQVINKTQKPVPVETPSHPAENISPAGTSSYHSMTDSC